MDQTKTKTIAERVTEALADELGLTIEQVKPEATLWDDLGADSLDLIELTMIIEDELGIEIDEQEMQGVTTVREFIDLAERKAKVIQ